MAGNSKRNSKDSQVDVVSMANVIPYRLLQNEDIDKMYQEEQRELVKLYEVYQNGADFLTEGTSGDYVPAQLRYKIARTLIDKQARFLFGRKPDFFVDVAEADGSEEQATVLQNLVDHVMTKNKISKKLLQAAKDCFIGKRVACFLNFNERGIGLRFANSMEFVFDTEVDDTEKLTKIAAFFTVKDSKAMADKRIYKKKYWMENGFCYVEEYIYDGSGNQVEEILAPTPTLFDFIPAVVIANDGLTGDVFGESEIGLLEDYESWYSKLANADKDAERKSMNPIRYAVDMSTSSTKDLSSAAGAFWDLASDQAQAEGAKGTVGVLESSMAYSTALKNTLERVKNAMHDQVDVPNVADLQAQLSSGKALKAIYWGMVVRCDEKMIAWKPALEFIISTIIKGALLYPDSAAAHVEDDIPDVVFSPRVDNQYPLPEDEVEGKQIDLAEVESQTMSRKSYMKKWRGLTDEEADEELLQIAREREILEDSFGLEPKKDNEEVDEEEPADDGEESEKGEQAGTGASEEPEGE